MTCDACRSQLAADGAIELDTREHIANCHACEQFADALRDTVTAARLLADGAVDEERLAAARAFVLERSRPADRARRYWAYAAAASLLLAGLLALQRQPLPAPNSVAIAPVLRAIAAPAVAHLEFPERAAAPAAEANPARVPAAAATKFVYVRDTEVTLDDGTQTTDAVVRVVSPGSRLQILWMVSQGGDD